MTRDLAIAILAAGGSSRMRGGDKLLQTIAGVPLIRIAALRALMTGRRVLVTLPPDRPDRITALEGMPVDRVIVQDAPSGMAASFRALAGLTEERLLVTLGDMPDIRAGHLMRMIDASARHTDRIVRATTEDGRQGQPIIFPRRVTRRFGELTGDTGARSLLGGERIVTVPLPGSAAITDLDTPEDWSAWRSASGMPP